MIGIGENEIAAVSAGLSQRDSLFLERIYAGGVQKYIDRLDAIGFSGQRANALDAGCGFGQWSVAMSSRIGHVVGIDVSQVRVDTVKKISREIPNLEFQQGSISQLPFPDNHFDFVFSFSVIYYTDVRSTIQELVRVLKPGGKVYICSNGIGWYCYNILKNPNASLDFNPRAYGLRTLLDSFLYHTFGRAPSMDGSVTTSLVYLSNLLQQSGVDVFASGAEGSVNLDPLTHEIKNFFPGRYLGLECCSEWLGVKKDVV